MPVYDCGAPDCFECERAFGPDRSKAIANYEARQKAYAALAHAPDCQLRTVETYGLCTCDFDKRTANI